MRDAISVRIGSLAIIALTSFGVGAQEASPQAAPNAVSSAIHVDACASDPSLLGISRIVEIDTAGGPQFGGGHGSGNDFLKDGEVVLTFDDGPLKPYTRPVLKALADQCTKATFFMVGRMAASEPYMVKEVAAAGHTVASHTWSHQNLRPLVLFKARQEFEMGLSAVTKALGHAPAAFFRYPYLSASRGIEQHIKNRNVSSIWVDVDSKDYLTRDSALVHSRIMAQLTAKRKGIILMHDIQPSTAGAIKGLLAELHAKGFKVVHIVPKSTVLPVAAYDGAVEKAFKSRSAKLAKNPLADRSVVWTMSPNTASGGNPPAAGAPSAPPINAAVPGAKATPAAGENLPWMPPAKTEPDAKAIAKTRKPSDAPTPAEQLPWQPKAFGY